jgi:exodeoxyribonuclease-3
MKVACWNVNSIRMRIERMTKWLEDDRPDVVCLQELKTLDEKFPYMDFEAVGYHAAVYGQKTYNGVAILSRSEPQDVTRGFGDAVDDAQARVIAATVDGVRVISVYVPNGQAIDSDKYPYKLAWLDRLQAYLTGNELVARPMVLCGDFNIARDDRDVCDVEKWEGGVLYNPDVRARLEGLLELGLVDTFRQHCDEAVKYSWWDYRQLAFPKKQGLRIDYILASNQLAERCTDAYIQRDQRKGKKPSDHAPIWAEFENL